jgi:hypothetical protein
MCPVLLRAGLASTAIFVPALCFAQSPANASGDILEERTRSSLSTASSSAPEPIATPAPEVSLNIIDQKLALSLAVDVWGQITANERALESATSEPLKALIAKRLNTQQAFATLLDNLTDGRTTSAIEDARREIAADAASTKTKVVRFRPLALQKNATAMMVRIRMEILEGYLADVQSGLAARSVDEFDQQFLHGDVLHQMQLLAMLEVFERQASADFAGVIHREAEAAREHLALSRQLLVQLETAPLVGTAAVAVEQR